MAADARKQALGQLLQQGQHVAQAVISQLKQQIVTLVKQAISKVQALIASIGARSTFDFNQILNDLQNTLNQIANQALGQLLGTLQGVIGGRASVDIGEIFNGFLQEIQGAVTGIGEHLLNQGLASVLGSLGSLTGSRAIGDIFSSLSEQIGAAVSAAQGALSGALTNLSALGSDILDASKPVRLPRLPRTLAKPWLRRCSPIPVTAP
eukprot:TRINITY_DN1957_c0_g2_i5.p1 TRINITY_DN1957_c0_g2~~TRINITY_DN1957_c0_g2_i5.p1  ORF type:complete len:241 (-),score=33.96 TRINITY_DN1957_c0_g2_i5:421-1044(-)